MPGNVAVASNKASNFPAAEVPEMVTVNVSGSQTYGSHSATLTYTTTPPDVAVTGTLRCTKVSTGATISPTLKAQAYTVDGTSCSGLSTTANYSLSYVGASGGFSVSKSHLTVTATSATRPYGAGNPAFSYKVSGFANTETTSVVSGSASCTTTATTKSAVGTYPITCTTGSLSAANYTLHLRQGDTDGDPGHPDRDGQVRPPSPTAPRCRPSPTQ